jgi:carboxymethylenebutenolidase
MNGLSEAQGLHDFLLARRGVLMTGLIAGFTLATERVEAQAVHTDASGIQAGVAIVPTTGGELPAYFAKPNGPGPFPVVLVNEEIFGVHEYIRDVCRRFAKAGYMAVATEYYARLGDLSAMTDVKQIIADVISKAPDERYMADLDATADWATQNGGSRGELGVMGFCRGGRQTWLYAAHNPNLRAAVAFYGQLGGAASPIQPKTATDLAPQILCPLLGLYGGQDQGIPAESVRKAESAAKEAGKTVEIVIYPEAAHGFHADYRPSYRQADAEDAFKRTLAWFARWGMKPAV